jgi:hypothetical protein
MCFDAEHFTSYTENFKVFAHQSGKFRVENNVTKSAKMHQIAYSYNYTKNLTVLMTK